VTFDDQLLANPGTRATRIGTRNTNPNPLFYAAAVGDANVLWSLDDPALGPSYMTLLLDGFAVVGWTYSFGEKEPFKPYTSKIYSLN
jgi:hypothetical protein